MATESDLEKRCRTCAENIGGRLIKIKTPGTRGFHDRVLLLPGYCAFIEFKSPKGTGRKSPMQHHWQRFMDAMKIPAFEVASYSHFSNICRNRR